RSSADGRRDDAVPHCPRSVDFARRILLRLQLHLCLWRLLHLPAAARRTCGTLGQVASRGDPEPPAIGGRPACSRGAARPHTTARRPTCPSWRITMVTFWVTILAVSMLLYVLLDGFDLGVGILFGVFGGETERRTMMSAVAPVWDGNETWLVVTAVVLWGCFPLVYSILLSAFYLPLLLMLAALVLRGVAFEYRARSQRRQWIWDAAFAGGSLVAAFMQGLTVGALVEGLPVDGTLYTGGAFGWLSPFALLCGVGLCIGYALLGACWLVKKCEGEVRKSAYRLISALSIGVLVFLAVVFICALAEN